MAVITLLTDFGDRDEYAGVMKGVILSVDPSAVIVDITHWIDPQDVARAAAMVESAWKSPSIGAAPRTASRTGSAIP